ncbi:hypothetical protein BZG01_03250 [Labilibaculum manganireducens]|uniref:O-antigen ligase domain-containing protein n=1 Tax=Labilibaculum manganireducens TaxID=1940525 RepID=A0A2N3IEL5_9BACT|nr:hypothetical protein [Labilibaculum manganireducens]PKQ68747.1 hypothetical protein BZG01_03250 [Labilibaculum manganireducens]
MDNLTKYAYVLFIGSCIFDPANKLLGLKMPLFILIMILLFLQRGRIIFEKKILIYVLVFSLLLPLLSITLSVIFSYDKLDISNGIFWIKPFLFLFLTFSLYNIKIDVVKILFEVLSVLSGIIVFVFLLCKLFDLNTSALYLFGNKYGIFTIQDRSFGSLKLFSMYFHTSPLIVFATTFYGYKFIEERKKRDLLFLLLNVLGLFLSGTRNNMFMSIFSIALVFLYYGSRKIKLGILLACFSSLLFLVNSGVISELLSKKEVSNQTKLAYIPDYVKVFDDVNNLIFGQGLGSRFYVNVHSDWVDNTELSYFELLRRFGIIIGFVYILMLFIPFVYINKRTAWILCSYFCYLIMINTNPFFFSSNGMLLLSIVLVYLVKNHQKLPYEFTHS